MSPPVTSKMNKQSQRALANQYREQQVERLNKLGRSLLLLLATVLSFATITLIAMDQLFRPDSFTIDQLKIKGKFSYMQPTDVEEVVRSNVIGNFFSVELDSIEQQVEALPWVERAEVRREWPDTLMVHISEHRPIMKWGKDRWVNSQGAVVELPGQIKLSQSIVLNGNQRDSKLILQRALQWAKELKAIGLTLESVSLSDSHAWKLGLSYPLNNYEFDMFLGRVDVDQRLQRFIYLFEEQFRQGGKQLQRVDARYPNGLAIKAEPLTIVEPVAVRQPETMPLLGLDR